MMHHPNMHHQAMSGHPPQHMPGHQGMPAHHQIPPHQMHRENRVPLGPSPVGGMGGHRQMGGMPGMGVPHHGPTQRPPHPIRAMPHHPPAQHHSVPPQQMKPMRRPYAVSGGYGGGAPMPPPYAPPPHMQPPPKPQPTHNNLTVVSTTVPCKPITNLNQANTIETTVSNDGGLASNTANNASASGSGSEGEARPAGTSPRLAPANSKEKTPMCLVNELARYNKIKHQYRLTSEMGPAHKKVFTVTLRLGDTEEYTAEGSSIKRAQHAAAATALSGTAHAPPPPRVHAQHAHAHHAHRHAGTVMPTVELNALAMKLCQPAIYTSVPGRPFRVPPPFVPARMMAPHTMYRVRVAVGERAWIGEGSTPQGARHDAAARALHDLRPARALPSDAPQAQTQPDPGAEENTDLLNSEVKSPVSLVHELALKRNLSVQFTVKSERGPPHMRVFITTCTVGDIETDGEGNGKKVSKRRAAELMLEEMKRRWPPALLVPRHGDKRRHQHNKKKPRNLVKEGGISSDTSVTGGADNPISRLAVARHSARARSPQYQVLEERGAARRREFLVQCTAHPHQATGLGPNKKTAKRRAALNVLLAMEMNPNSTENNAPATEASTNGVADVKATGDTKRKEGEAPGTGGANADVRQPVPGVLMMDYHQRSGQPSQPNGVSESASGGAGGCSNSAGGNSPGAGGSSPGAKDQLLYLSQLLGFTVQFSDFPKRNHGEYLSLVSLSTEPPVMCHGGGASTARSHESCARAALRALALMGLDAPGDSTLPSIPPSTTSKPGVLSSGTE